MSNLSISKVQVITGCNYLEAKELEEYIKSTIIKDPKPCRFCGSEPRITLSEDGVAYLQCSSAACSSDCYSPIVARGDDVNDAVVVWNYLNSPQSGYSPDIVHTAFDEDDNEIETNEADPDGCDYVCECCGYMMSGGECGWFDEIEGPYGGYLYNPRFNFCPDCGVPVFRKVPS